MQEGAVRDTAKGSHWRHAAIAAIGAVEVAAGLAVALIWSTLPAWAQLCVAWLAVEAIFYLLQCFRCVGGSSVAPCGENGCTLAASCNSTALVRGSGTCSWQAWCLTVSP